MATTALFDEDEVCFKDENGVKFGLVLENSEYASSDDEENDADNDDPDVLKKGHVRVAWHPDGEEEVLNENKLDLVDRSLMPGDVVRRLIEGQDSQRGYVRNTNVLCHIQLMSRNKFITNISSRVLEPMQYWDAEPGHVSLDSWVGRIVRVVEDLFFKLQDGAKFKISSEDFDRDLFSFEDINEKREPETEFCNTSYYPGQQFCGSSKNLKDCHWLKTTILNNPDVFQKQDKYRELLITLEKVEVKNLEVEWMCRGFAKSVNDQSNAEPPPRNLAKADIKRLKKLDCFESSSIQIGDKAFYTICEGDDIRTVNSRHRARNSAFAWKPVEGATAVDALNAENVERTTVAVDKTDVVAAEDEDAWDEECDSDADITDDQLALTRQSLLPFRTQKKLVRKKRLSRARARNRRLAGVDKPVLPGERMPVEVICTKSMAEVMWQDGTVERDIPSASLFPIHHLDENEFFPGDFVLPGTPKDNPYSYGVVCSVDHAGRTCVIKWMTPHDDSQVILPKEPEPEEVSVYDIRDHSDYKFRPGHVVVKIAGVEGEDQNATGQIYELLPSGGLLVRWADGTMSKCSPQHLYLLGDEYSDGSDDDTSSDVGDSDTSWETEDEREIGSGDEVQDEKTLKAQSEADGDIIMSDQGAEEQASKCEETMDDLELKMELDKLLESVRSIEQVLEEKLSSNNAKDYPDCCKCIVRMNRSCREIDRLLDSNYFEDSALQQAVSQVKRVFRQERGFKIVRDLNSYGLVYHNYNTKSVETQTHPLVIDPEVQALADKMKKALQEQVDIQKAKLKAKKDGAQEIRTEAKSDALSGATSDGACSSSAPNTDTARPAANLDFQMQLQNVKLITEDDIKRIAVDICEAQVKVITDNLDSLAKGEGRPTHKSTQCTLDALFPDAAELCRKTHALLKQQLTKVKSDLDIRWQLLRDKGLLKEIGIENCSDDEDCDVTHSSEPQSPTSPVDCPGFSTVENVHSSHHYYSRSHQPTDAKAFLSAIRKEVRLLNNSLPNGIFVKGFDDRIDLFSVMVVGPADTPYEDGLFFFDVQLPNEYPTVPPIVFYNSYCSDRLNPNLYEDGKVCVSLLGTWTGRGTEVWTSKSSLLQVLVSIQGLILVPEPYFNEAGYEKQKGTQQGSENSRMYNEMAIVKMIQSMVRITVTPYCVFETEIRNHLHSISARLLTRLESWLHESSNSSDVPNVTAKPQPIVPFPLLPVSKGFRLTLSKEAKNLREALNIGGITHGKDSEQRSS